LKEPGETDEQGLIREVKEELSVDILPESMEYYGTFKAQAHGKPEGTIAPVDKLILEDLKNNNLID